MDKQTAVQTLHTLTMLDCISRLVARLSELRLDPAAIKAKQGFGDTVVIEQIQQLLKEYNFAVEQSQSSWGKLRRLASQLPCMARLNNGNVVLLYGFRTVEGEERIHVFDPLADAKEPLLLPQRTFEKAWDGTVLTVRAKSPYSDEGKSFGIWWFMDDVKKYKPYFVGIAISTAFTNLFALVSSFFMMLVLDRVVGFQATTTLHTLGVGITILLIFDALFGWFKNHFSVIASSRIDRQVVGRCFDHLLRLPITYFDHAPRGVIARNMQQSEKIRQFLTGRLFSLALDLIFVLMYLAVLFVFSWITALIVLITGLVLIGISAAFGPAVRSRVKDLYAIEGRREALLTETIAGMAVIKALALEERQRRILDLVNEAIEEKKTALQRLSTRSRLLTHFVEQLMVVALIWVGAALSMDGTLTTGAFVASVLLARRVSSPLVQMSGCMQEYQEMLVSVRLLGEVMDRSPEQTVTGGEKLRLPVQGEVSFEGVNFSYEGNTYFALRDLNVQIQPGSLVGIVGRSGSGKTTLTRLVLGLYPTKAGVIRVDGYDIREYDLTHLRRCMGTVLQENILFRGTVRQNIAAANEGASFEEIMRAAQLAGADEFIQKLPQGYETLLDESATNLSGGQRQRLALARALVRDPSILILDEATSALDPESEAAIRRNLAQIRKGRTVLIISHRLTMLTEADSIIVMDDGRIVDEGRHSVLLQRCPIYQRLWQEQRL